MKQAVNREATVTETIPGENAGMGKIVLAMLNERVEYQAVTTAREIPAGAQVRIVALIDAHTVQVLPVVDFDQVWQVFRGRGETTTAADGGAQPGPEQGRGA
jgi:hypothetical protein